MNKANWVLCKFKNDNSYYTYCSNCKHVLKASYNIDGLVEIPLFERLSKSCPVCNCEMRAPEDSFCFELYDKVGDQIERCK